MLLPFYPVTPQEVLFEKDTHKSIHYPLHSIVLKGSKIDKILYCYIELFSTFQYIVIVDDDYEGEDIYHNYIYDLLNSKEINYEKYLDSVINNSIFRNILLDYKHFNKKDLDYIAYIRIAQHDSLKLYCYNKFNQLESFVAFASLTEKLDILDKTITNN